MAAVDGLRRLGFSENEAKVYVALLGHPGSTGYEVSRHSGVPRAKVYEVLEGLSQRGAVLAEPSEERTTYRARSYAALLQEYRRSTEALVADLYRDLAREAVEETRPATSTVSGRARVLSRAAELGASARHTLLAAGRPEELQALGGLLAEAERRGVQVQVLSYGPVRLSVSEVYVHAGRREEGLFCLVSDGAALCQAEIGVGEDAYAVFIANRGIARGVAAWLRREMAIGEIDRLIGERLGDILPAAALQQMQRLWRG